MVWLSEISWQADGKTNSENTTINYSGRDKHSRGLGLTKGRHFNI